MCAKNVDQNNSEYELFLRSDEQLNSQFFVWKCNSMYEPSIGLQIKKFSRNVLSDKNPNFAAVVITI